MTKCHDCGGLFELPKFPQKPKSLRPDICDWCWDNRMWLVGGKGLPTGVTIAEFQAIQRAMANRRGTAKRKIEALKARLQP